MFGWSTTPLPWVRLPVPKYSSVTINSLSGKQASCRTTVSVHTPGIGCSYVELHHYKVNSFAGYTIAPLQHSYSVKPFSIAGIPNISGLSACARDSSTSTGSHYGRPASPQGFVWFQHDRSGQSQGKVWWPRSGTALTTRNGGKEIEDNKSRGTQRDIRLTLSSLRPSEKTIR